MYGISISNVILTFNHEMILKKSSSRFSNIGLGALAIAFSILVMAFPVLSVLFLIFLGGFALLFNGVARIIQGVGGHGISGWSRALLVGVGVLSIVVSGLVIAQPIGFGVPLLAVVLLIIGIEMMVMGAVGGDEYYSSIIIVFSIGFLPPVFLPLPKHIIILSMNRKSSYRFIYTLKNPSTLGFIFALDSASSSCSHDGMSVKKESFGPSQSPTPVWLHLPPVLSWNYREGLNGMKDATAVREASSQVSFYE